MSLLDSKDSRREAHLFIAVLGAAAGIFFVGWDVIVHAAHFEIQDFGIGYGALIGGIGVGSAGVGYQRSKETQ